MSAPTGCSLVSYSATCDYASWSPPLMDHDFSKSPSSVLIQSINGEIPSNAFSGLTNADNDQGSGGPELTFQCGFTNSYTLTLLSDSLTSNLSWVERMSISDCYNMNINDGAMSVLTGVTILTFLAGSFSTLSSTAFTGMTSLQTLYLYAPMPTSGIPSGLFSGLTALTTLDMSRTAMYSIPSGLFDDLKNLTTLTIEETGVTTLPADVFHPLLSLNSLTLDFNDWVCDCNLQWLGEYLTSTSLTTTTCALPASLTGYDLQRAVQSLTCTTTSTSSDDWKPYVYALIGGVSLALIIAIIACICCCRNRRKLRKLYKSRDQDRNSAKPRQRDEISNSSNWVAKTGYVSIEKKKSMTPVEESRYQPPEVKSSTRPQPYVSSTEESWTPRMMRSTRVSPQDVRPSVPRAQIIADRRANLELF